MVATPARTEASTRLTISRPPQSASRCIEVQVGCMFAKGLFNICRRQPLQNIPDSRVSRRPLPADLEGLVKLSPMDLDEGADAAIRVGSGHNRQNGKQQDIR